MAAQQLPNAKGEGHFVTENVFPLQVLWQLLSAPPGGGHPPPSASVGADQPLGGLRI